MTNKQDKRMKDVMDIINSLYELESSKDGESLIYNIEDIRDKVVTFLKENVENLSIVNEEFKKDLTKLDTPKLNTEKMKETVIKVYEDQIKDIKTKYNLAFAEATESKNLIKSLEEALNNVNAEKTRLQLEESSKIKELQHELSLWKSKEFEANEDARILELTDELSSLKDELSKTQAELKEYRDNLEVQTNNVRQKENLIAELEDKLVKIKNVHEVLPTEDKSVNSDLQQKVASYDVQVTVLSAENTSLKNTNKSYAEQIKQLEKLLDEERKKDRVDVSEVDGRIEKVKEEFKDKQKKYEYKLSEYEDMLDTASITSQLQSAQIKQLVDKLKQISSLLEKVNEIVEDNQEER